MLNSILSQTIKYLKIKVALEAVIRKERGACIEARHLPELLLFWR